MKIKLSDIFTIVYIGCVLGYSYLGYTLIVENEFKNVAFFMLVALIAVKLLSNNGILKVQYEKKVFFYYGLLIFAFLCINYLFISEFKARTGLFFWIYSPIIFMLVCKLDTIWYIRIIKVIHILSILLAFSVLIEVVMPSFFTSTLRMFYSTSRIYVMQREISKGIYSGFVAEKAYAAHLLAVGIAIELSTVFDSKTLKLRKSNVFWILLECLAIMLTSKRTLAIIVAAMIIITIILGNYKNKVVKIVPIFLALFVLMIIAVSVIPQAQILLQRLLETSEDLETMNSRVYFWQVALEMFSKKPLWGYGLGSYMSYQELYSSVNGYNAHNSYIQLLGETGIMGAVLFFSLFLISLVDSSLGLLKKRTQGSFLCFFFVFLSLVYALTGNVMHTFAQLFIYYFALAMLENGIASINLDTYLFKEKTN